MTCLTKAKECAPLSPRGPGGPRCLKFRFARARFPRSARSSSGSKPRASIGRTSFSARVITRRRPGASDVLGLEIAGEVVARRPNATVHSQGARVTALVPGGGYADYCVAHETNALPIPAGLTAIEAAAIPETYFTVWTNVFARGALKGRRNLAGAWRNVRHRHDGDRARQGVRRARRRHRRIGREGRAMRAAGRRSRRQLSQGRFRRADPVGATGGRGADVILDMVGGDYVERNYAAAALDGRIVQIAFLRARERPIDLRPIMVKRLIHTGSTLRPRSPAEKAVIAEALRAKVWPLLEAGRCRPVIDSVFPLADGRKAHERIESAGAYWQDRADDVSARPNGELEKRARRSHVLSGAGANRPRVKRNATLTLTSHAAAALDPRSPAVSGNPPTADSLSQIIVEGLEDAKAEDIVSIDLRGKDDARRSDDHRLRPFQRARRRDRRPGGQGLSRRRLSIAERSRVSRFATGSSSMRETPSCTYSVRMSAGSIISKRCGARIGPEK